MNRSLDPRLILIVPLIVVVGLLIIVGLRLGIMAVTTSETDVINRYANKYVAQFGTAARESDCSAVPGEIRGIWLVVSCVSADGASFQYFVNRLGGLEYSKTPENVVDTAPLEDQT